MVNPLSSVTGVGKRKNLLPKNTHSFPPLNENKTNCKIDNFKVVKIEKAGDEEAYP